ncbi:hypothetical protein EVAR_5999_1 [Eumeta japonica]|uniref:Uncharacterized protein n=1 Tax=Eumeta variegata TaxID=151549 RepID=A0A4C1TCN6_EUMVA|nr:hypothetical protein EVAR_5999_1 [Eumeta japonica]
MGGTRCGPPSPPSPSYATDSLRISLRPLIKYLTRSIETQLNYGLASRESSQRNVQPKTQSQEFRSRLYQPGSDPDAAPGAVFQLHGVRFSITLGRPFGRGWPRRPHSTGGGPSVRRPPRNPSENSHYAMLELF